MEKEREIRDKQSKPKTVRFSDFSLKKYLLLFIENPLLVTDIATFSVEVKDICKWIDAAKVQLELIESQKNIVLKESSVIVHLRSFGRRKFLQAISLFVANWQHIFTHHVWVNLLL